MAEVNQHVNGDGAFSILRQTIAVLPPEFGKDAEVTTSRPLRGTLTTDRDGWPLIHFDSQDRGLTFVSSFLQSDVDILLPSCDLLLEKINTVLKEALPCWKWNGNSFIVEVEKERSTLIDKYGDGETRPTKATVDTDLLLVIIGLWKRFVAELPRQRELAAAEAELRQLHRSDSAGNSTQTSNNG
jgi:hypothetical protein